MNFSTVNNFTSWLKEQKKKNIKKSVINLCQCLSINIALIASEIGLVHQTNNHPAGFLLAMSIVFIGFLAFVSLAFLVGHVESFISPFFYSFSPDSIESILKEKIKESHFYSQKSIDSLINFLLTCLIEKNSLFSKKTDYKFDFETVKSIQSKLLYNQTLLEEYNSLDKMPSEIKTIFKDNEENLISMLSVRLYLVKNRKLLKSESFKNQLENVSLKEKFDFFLNIESEQLEKANQEKLAQVELEQKLEKIKLKTNQKLEEHHLNAPQISSELTQALHKKTLSL
jgi:hypothetical protein